MQIISGTAFGLGLARKLNRQYDESGTSQGFASKSLTQIKKEVSRPSNLKHGILLINNRRLKLCQ